MGTRNLIAVFSGGEFKIAQYAQWDGYPSGQGRNVLEFLRKKGNIDKLRDALPHVRFLDPDGVDKQFMEEYNANAPEWSNQPDKRTDAQKFWFERFISRDIGANILDAVADTPDHEIILRNGISFAGDSLFCEYAYVVDFDRCVFEVYRGFVKEKEIVVGRFSDPSLKLDKSDGYAPVTLVKTYSLFNLPGVKTFIKQAEKACG